MNFASVFPKNFPLRSILILLSLLVFVGFLGYFIELSLPTRSPKLDTTYTPLTQSTPQEIGSYDLLGYTVNKAEAEQLLQTKLGQLHLAPENGAIPITENLIKIGRDAFYRETFGNEYFFTDVVGAINGPINLLSMGDLVQFLLSIDDDPAVLPESASKQVADVSK